MTCWPTGWLAPGVVLQPKAPGRSARLCLSRLPAVGGSGSAYAPSHRPQSRRHQQGFGQIRRPAPLPHRKMGPLTVPAALSRVRRELLCADGGKTPAFSMRGRAFQIRTRHHLPHRHAISSRRNPRPAPTAVPGPVPALLFQKGGQLPSPVSIQMPSPVGCTAPGAPHCPRGRTSPPALQWPPASPGHPPGPRIVPNAITLR